MKDFKELIENYQEFMELLGEKIELLCHSNGRSKYNAFADKDNHVNIMFSENKILVDVIDGEDSFKYEVFISEFTDNAEDKELEELYLQLSEAESNHNKAQGELNLYVKNKEIYEELNEIYGVVGSRYDIVNYQMHVKELNKKIEYYKNQSIEIQEKISYKVM